MDYFGVMRVFQQDSCPNGALAVGWCKYTCIYIYISFVYISLTCKKSSLKTVMRLFFFFATGFGIVVHENEWGERGKYIKNLFNV